MLFNSPAFLFYYLPAIMIGFAIAARYGRTPVVAWLAFMSLVFYTVWRPAFVIILLGSIVINYGCAAMIWRNVNNAGRKRLWMWIGIAVDLGALVYFKYLYSVLQWAHGTGLLHSTFDNVVLPLGISFFTFTQIAYLIDLAQGEAERQDFISYVLFVTFYPHLIAGPILHHGEIMPQFAPARNFKLRWDDVALGLSWFVMGLGKKVLIADHISKYADITFAHAHGLNSTEAWLGVLNYAMQLYFDFSGYSDMAVGLARMMSIQLPFNFDSPYKSAGIIEFWQRWHMTLSRYLNLYLYNPIAMAISRGRVAAGKKTSKKATRTLEGFTSMVATPTLITMFLAGIWHGAGTHFVLFGVIHGVYLTINQIWRVFRNDSSAVVKFISARPVSVAITFLAVCIGHVFFRAESTTDAMHILGGLFGLNGLGLGSPGVLQSWKAAQVLLLLPVVWFLPNTQQIFGQVAEGPESRVRLPRLLQWQPNLAWAAVMCGMLVGVLFYMTGSTSFLYFQF